jgi:hypothetical protein
MLSLCSLSLPGGMSLLLVPKEATILRRHDHSGMSRNTRSFLCNVFVLSPGVFLREASSLLIREEVVNGLSIRSPPIAMDQPVGDETESPISAMSPFSFLKAFLLA